MYIFYVILSVIFINVSDTACVAVLWNLWSGFKGYVLNSFFCYFMLCVHWVKRLKMISSIKILKTRVVLFLSCHWCESSQLSLSHPDRNLLPNKNGWFFSSLQISSFSAMLGIQRLSDGLPAQWLREANLCHVLLGPTGPARNLSRTGPLLPERAVVECEGICIHPKKRLQRFCRMNIFACSSNSLC